MATASMHAEDDDPDGGALHSVGSLLRRSAAAFGPVPRQHPPSRFIGTCPGSAATRLSQARTAG